jgi:DNA-binding ferritin-like protein
METKRMLKRNPAPVANYATAGSSANCDTMTAACATELMNAASSFHKLHLKVKGIGSYSAHKALNDLYDALPEHADTLIEGYQGAAEKILEYSEIAPRTLNTVEEGIAYLKDMYQMVNALQAKMPYSEIVNSLDGLKDTINSAKYKLLFLK